MDKKTSNKNTKIKFSQSSPHDFHATLKRKVEAFFEKKQVNFQGNYLLYGKAIFLGLTYIAIYIAIISNHFYLLSLIILYASLGIVKALIGFNVIHDALHNAFFSKRIFNKILGYWFDVNGTSSFIWKVSHNQHHHIYTNIPGHDDDIDKAILLRLNPVDKIYWFHKYQHIYAPILYSLIGFNWIFYSDYAWFFREIKKRIIPKQDLFLFFSLKLINLALFLIIPIIYLTVPWWYVFIGYSCMQICGGLLISIIFQLAHIVDNVHFFQPDTKGTIPNSWAKHEMLTTSNFATNNFFLTHLIGGLNFQVEHHLFSHISHVHYPKISKIVKATAEEFNIPYFEQPSFWQAIQSHFRTLKRLSYLKL